ncbi:MAG: PQQ-binding-like beta-propeller repeat protein, partial [Gemmataceae bacterium]
TQLLKINKQASGAFAAEGQWSQKYEGHMTTPVVVKNHAYFLGKDQRFVCFDLNAGKETWRTEKSFGKYWSLVANGDQILALDNKGILLLIKANPAEFELVAQKKIADGETWAHLAVDSGDVIIRELDQLAVYGWSKP